MNTLYVLAGVGVAIVGWVIMAYNRLVALTNRGKEAWADIDVQLKRRYDLIPNLIETVKGYVAHERETLESVTNARVKAMGVGADAGIGEHAAVENMLSGALKSLFAVAENYPDLKANTNFIELQRELADTENKIQAARRFYNSVVQDLQNALEQFPSNIIAGQFGFTGRDFFELEDGEEAARKPVAVKF